MNLRSKVNFSHNKFNYYMGGMGDVRIPLISWKRGVIKFDLCCKRGKKIYKQLFKNEFYAKEEEYDKYLFYKLKELLIMLERTIEHGYIFFANFTKNQAIHSLIFTGLFLGSKFVNYLSP